MSIVSKVYELSRKQDVNKLEIFLKKVDSKQITYLLTCMMYLGRGKINGEIPDEAGIDTMYKLGVEKDKEKENMKELLENYRVLSLYFDETNE